VARTYWVCEGSPLDPLLALRVMSPGSIELSGSMTASESNGYALLFRNYLAFLTEVFGLSPVSISPEDSRADARLDRLTIGPHSRKCHVYY
jgi:hypothetical protein